eukprot:253863-Pyramimonas_sp.AAC.2
MSGGMRTGARLRVSCVWSGTIKRVRPAYAPTGGHKNARSPAESSSGCPRWAARGATRGRTARHAVRRGLECYADWLLR